MHIYTSICPQTTKYLLSPTSPATTMPLLLHHLLLLLIAACSGLSNASTPWPHRSNNTAAAVAKRELDKFEGSSPLVHLTYHMGPVLSTNATIFPIWYGSWRPSQKRIIRSFLLSLSSAAPASPSVSTWWRTARLYSDQTGAAVTPRLHLGPEWNDPRCATRGRSLTRLTVQSLIGAAVSDPRHPLPVDPRGGVYLVLTGPEVTVQDFCRAACGFHYFTFPAIVGHALPYAWVGNSAKQCPGSCAYPFAPPPFAPSVPVLKPPNGDVGVDGMVSVIGHELAELASDPFANAWYAGSDPSFPTEIADLCEGIYGSGAGGSYIGQVRKGADGASYNMHGVDGRRFLVQWLWDQKLKYCTGPNAIDRGR